MKRKREADDNSDDDDELNSAVASKTDDNLNNNHVLIPTCNINKPTTKSELPQNVKTDEHIDNDDTSNN